MVSGLVAGGALAANEPNIAFAYPAGAQQGTTFDMEIGGQYFNGATNVFVSGEGVSVEIGRYAVKYEPRRIGQIYRNRENARALLKDPDADEKSKQNARKRIQQSEAQIALIDLPPGVDRNDKKAVQKIYRNSPKSKEQFNPQLQDRLHVKVTVAKDAPPGERELRVYTPAGLSNPFYFQVGTLEEMREFEPNDDHMSPDLQTVPVPSVINGQVRPGDIDHYRFKAEKGDSVVIDVGARRIIPYLADAVPGWFQAVVALYDEDGNEVAYQDDYKFNPDPVLFFDVPESGVYTLSIRDSIYRGREDFIYRIAIGELPFITAIFPLGAQEGQDVDIALTGRNLPKKRLTGKLPANGHLVRHVSVKKAGYRSNPMPFAVGELPEAFEKEPNNEGVDAQHIQQPMIINGRIQPAGDRDRFSFKGEEGDTVSIEVVARRLNSPLDSVITLTGPGMDQPVRNDDYVTKDKTHLHLGAGLVTHHADSYIHHVLPATGTYHIEIGDTQGKGGHDYGYRLRISRSDPDFKLRMEPSGLHIGPGGTAAFSVRAMRTDGFEGEIRLGITNLPPGFVMSEAVIPAKSDMARFTITASKKIEGKLVSPQVTGSATVNDRTVVRKAVPVDDQMQAFLYRHLVPAQELVLAPVTEQPPVVFEARIPKSGIIEIPAGGKKWISFDGRIFTGQKGYSVKLDHPPEGFSTEKNGWVGRKKLQGKNKDGKPKLDKKVATGGIQIFVDEAVEPGTTLSLVVAAEIKKGRDVSTYPAPAIPVRVVAGKD
jgi:hypothetical protein